MDLVTFGEALLRLSPRDHQPLERAQAFDAHVGGSELNVAVAAARLGTSAAWVSRLPESALGRLIERRARDSGVDARVEWGGAAGDRVGLYFLEQGSAPRQSNVLYDRAGSAFSKIAPGTVDWPSLFRDTRWFHVSGITPALSDSAAAVTAEAMRAARTAGLTVSYDINYRGKLWIPGRARAVQEPLLAFVDVLVISEEDARTVFGEHEETPGDTARAIAERLNLGVVAITVRDSGDGCGAAVAAGEAIFSAARVEVEVVDRVGAGDAFTAGLIVSRLQRHDWDRALRFATALAALKLTIRGDFCTAARADVDRLLLQAQSAATR